MSNGLVQPIVECDETINLAHQAGYLLGQADSLMKCAGKIAELTAELAGSKVAVNALEDQLRQNGIAPLTDPQPDGEGDDPLTMSIERLRECVAVEVMEWGQSPDRLAWMWRHGSEPTRSIAKQVFHPDTNSAHWQMVKDKMRERGFALFLNPYSVLTLPPTLHYRVGYVRNDGVCIAEIDSLPEDEGEAICRAALLAVRYLPKEEGVGDHDA